MAAINIKAQATVLGLVSLAFAFPVQANAYSNDDLVYMVRAEEKAFGHADLKMSLDQRLDALEASVLGSRQTGNSSQRLRRVMEKLEMVAPSTTAAPKTEIKKSKVTTKKTTKVRLASKQKRLVAAKRQSKSYAAPTVSSAQDVQEQVAPAIPQEPQTTSEQTDPSIQQNGNAPTPVVVVLLGAVGAIVLGCLGIVIYLFMRVKDETVSYARETNEVLIGRRRNYTNETEEEDFEGSTGFQPSADGPVYAETSAAETNIQGNDDLLPVCPTVTPAAINKSTASYAPAFEIFDEGYADFAVEYKAADAVKEIVERFSAEPEVPVEITQTAPATAVALVAPIPPVPPATPASVQVNSSTASAAMFPAPLQMPDRNQTISSTASPSMAAAPLQTPTCNQVNSSTALPAMVAAPLQIPASNQVTSSTASPAMVAAPPQMSTDQVYALGTSEKEPSRKIEPMHADSDAPSDGFASWMRRVVDAAHTTAEDTASSAHLKSFVSPEVSHSFLEEESQQETSYTIYAMPPENVEAAEIAPAAAPSLSIPYGDEEYNSELYDTYTNLSVTEFFWSDMPQSRQEPLMTENSYKSSTLISTEDFLAGLLEQTTENKQDSPSTTADSPTGLVDQCDFVAKYAHPNSAINHDAFAALNAVLAPAYKVENTMDNQDTTYQATAYDIDFASHNDPVTSVSISEPSEPTEPPSSILTVSEVRSRKTSEIDVQLLAAQNSAAGGYQDEDGDEDEEGDEEDEELDEGEGEDDEDFEDDEEGEEDEEDFEDEEEIAKSGHEVEWTSNEYAELAKQLIQCLSGICESAGESVSSKPRAGRRTLQKLAISNSIGKQTFTSQTKIVSADFDMQLRTLFSAKESA